MRLSFEGDPQKATRFIGKVQQELDRLQARMSSAGLDRGTFQYVIDDISYAYGYILPGGMRVAHIVVGDVAYPVIESVDTIETKTPDFLSGYVGDGLVENPVAATKYSAEIPALLRSFTPSGETARVHSKELTRLPKVARLAVYPWVAFEADGRGDMMFAQTQTIYPTMYSGLMRKLVQALLGFGKQPNGKGDISIFDAVDQSYDVIDGDTEEPAQTRYELDVETNGLQVRYDYRFMRTHGVTVAADGKLWLIEIGMNRGIIAMQLPLHEHTKTEAFRDLVYKADRQEALVMLDEFGGFPTGEAFPNTVTSLDANIRAGRVLRLKTAAEMSEFYSHTGYSSTMGWAFNSRGTEAHNTAWRYGDEGVQRGAHYAVSLMVGAFISVEPSTSAAGVKELIAEVQPKRQEQFDAVMFKIDRMTKQQLDDIVRDGIKAIDLFDAIDAVVIAPCAASSAGVSKCSEGNIYWRTPKGQPQIKFPEPILGGLLSHDMRPSSVQNTAPLCDTVMHVFFSGDDLKWVKYYNNASQWRAGWTWGGDDLFDIANTPVGNFYRSYVLGPVIVPAMFYSTDFDPREELPVSEFEWFYRRKVVGNTPPWAFSSAGGNPPSEYCLPKPDISSALGPSVLYQTKWFTDDYDLRHATTRSIESGVVAPFYDREAYYFSTLRKRTGGHVMHAKGYASINSPHISWDSDKDQDYILEGASFFSSAPTAGWEIYEYRKDWADDGPIGGGDIRNYRISNNDDPYHQWNTPYTSLMVYKPAEGWLETRLITSSDYDNITIEVESKTGDEPVAYFVPLWFLPSPDEFGDYQHIGETSNVFGATSCMVYGIELIGGKREVAGSPEAAKYSDYYPCFIGPNNG